MKIKYSIRIRIAIVVAAATYIYLHSISGSFILDDNWLLAKNKLIHSSSGLASFWFSTEPIDYWPITNSTLWLEWHLWGDNPVGYHVVSLMLHIVESLLLWRILVNLKIPGGFLAALLFAVHPINVAAVAWVSQQKTLLAMFFSELSVLCYLNAYSAAGMLNSKHENPSVPIRVMFRSRWYWLSLAAFIAGVLSKGSVLTLPLLLLLLLWWLAGRISKSDVWPLMPFALAAILLTFVNIWFQTHGGPSVRSVSLAARFIGAFAALWFYLWKAVVPFDLLFVYPLWDVLPENPRWWLPFLGTVFLTAILWQSRSNRFGRAMLFVWLFFCIALIPVLGFVDVGFMRYSLVANHYLHLAVVAICALIGSVFAVVGKWENYRWQGATRIAAGLLVCIWGCYSFQESRLYADPIRLYQATLAENPNSWYVEYMLGTTFEMQGQPEEAIQWYERAISLNPDYPEAQTNLGYLLAKIGKTESAIPHYDVAIKANPEYTQAHFDLAAALLALGQTDSAIDEYRLVLKQQPTFPFAHYNLGNADSAAGKYSQAVDEYELELNSNPKSVAAHNNIAEAFKALGQTEQALDHYRKAVSADPTNAAAHANYGKLLSELKRNDDALREYQTALKLEPDSAVRQYDVGLSYVENGKAEAAIDYFQRALKLQPDFLEAAINLAIVCEQVHRNSEAIDAAQLALKLALAKNDVSLTQQIREWLNAHEVASQQREKPPTRFNPPPP